MAPELFLTPIELTQAVDIYALGITFYRLVTHKFPVNKSSFGEQGRKMRQMKSISKPVEITDGVFWDLLSRMLEFDPDKRITAANTLKHPYFTSPEAIADVSSEQQELASLATITELQDEEINQEEINEEGNDPQITKFDKNPTFIVAESVIKQFIINELNPNKQQSNEKNIGIENGDMKESLTKYIIIIRSLFNLSKRIIIFIRCLSKYLVIIIIIRGLFKFLIIII
ncbi:MAG: hypothetical protein EZS28_034327 [Streblomastix strix]|uniref:Protein kinase domain-containing protein n=1 Tax=Streblomastix strix TaxID=222440 RepID=A0A5J4UI67_9EUKA|nr:MAG: hypothetical protein EZS28_034327 [Streblomastix strix]